MEKISTFRVLKDIKNGEYRVVQRYVFQRMHLQIHGQCPQIRLLISRQLSPASLMTAPTQAKASGLT